MEKFRRDYAPTPYAIESVDLNFDIHDEETFVTSTLQIAPRAGTKGEPLVLDGEQLRLVSIAVDGAALDASAFEYKCVPRRSPRPGAMGRTPGEPRPAPGEFKPVRRAARRIAEIGRTC